MSLCRGAERFQVSEKQVSMRHVAGIVTDGAASMRKALKELARDKGLIGCHCGEHAAGRWAWSLVQDIPPRPYSPRARAVQVPRPSLFPCTPFLVWCQVPMAGGPPGGIVRQTSGFECGRCLRWLAGEVQNAKDFCVWLSRGRP